MTRRAQRGFTLMEMMVVMGIIMVLAGVLFGAYSKLRQKADIAKAQDLVSSAATALTAIVENEGSWPGYLVAAAGASDSELDETACRSLASRSAFSLSYKTSTDSNGTTVYTLIGNDRCGIVDPWAAAVIRRADPSLSGSALKSRTVPSGGKVEDHILRFAIDLDYDGITVARVGTKSLKIRASAVVWSCGPNGVFDDYDKVGRTDDVYSWQKGQVQQQ